MTHRLGQYCHCFFLCKCPFNLLAFRCEKHQKDTKPLCSSTDHKNCWPLLVLSEWEPTAMPHQWFKANKWLNVQRRICPTVSLWNQAVGTGWTGRINGRVQAFQAPPLMIHSQPWESSLGGNKTVIYCLITNKIYNSRSGVEGINESLTPLATVGRHLLYVPVERGYGFCFGVGEGEHMLWNGQTLKWTRPCWQSPRVELDLFSQWVTWGVSLSEIMSQQLRGGALAGRLVEDNCCHASVQQCWRVLYT